MMPRVLWLLALLACGTGLAAARRSLLIGPDNQDPFGKAMRVVAEFGYTVVAADRPTGFLRAERQATGAAQQILAGSTDFWIVTITLLDSAQTKRYVVQPDIRREGGAVLKQIGGKQLAEVDSITAHLARP